MIKMEDLRRTFESLGFTNVVSYINSGNLAFDFGKLAEFKLVAKIEDAIEKGFGKRIPVMIREQPDIARILAGNPFDGQYETHKQMHVLFMSDAMSPDKVNELESQQLSREKFAVKGREIYALLLDGVAESLLTKGYIERKLKTMYTGRNWRTVQKLATL